jgi:MbtH protein
MDANGASEKPARQEYRVVVNHEEQYSIWPTFKEIPLGWKDAGVAGTKEECLAHIEKVWTDIRPLSVRLAEEAQRASRPVTQNA